MRDSYTTRVTYQMTEEVGEYLLVEKVNIPYHGLWDECKKGREQMSQNMKADAATAAQNRAQSQAAYLKAQGLLEPSMTTAPNQLTEASQSQLGSDLDNINRAYSGMREQAAATIGRRGFGGAPSGFSQVAQNGADLGQANAGTQAFRNAQVNSQNQRNFATTTEAGLSGQQGSLGNSASGESTGAAVDLNHAGSTAGDILGGIAQIAPIAAAPFTGGLSLFPQLAAFNRLGNRAPSAPAGPSSGVGTYGGSIGASSPGAFGLPT